MPVIDPAAQYITLQTNRLALQSLLEQIDLVLSGGLTTLRLSDSLRFYTPVGSSGSWLGGLRYNEVTHTIEYSNNGNSSNPTWQPLSADVYRWVAGRSYTTGDVVLHSTGWYACNSATSTAVPGQSTSWRLLTAGTSTYFVSDVNELVYALESGATRIQMKGIFSTSGDNALVVNVAASRVTIISEESADCRGLKLAITMPSGGNIYWHANNTIGGGVLTAVSGTLWIEHLQVLSGYSLTLAGDIRYQRIDGTFTGGTQSTWCDQVNADAVPKDLTPLYDYTAYSDEYRLYVQAGSSAYGRIQLGVIGSGLARHAVAYFKIDATGDANDKPAYADAGYTYYASDTGDLYIYNVTSTSSGYSSGWGPAIHIKGEPGEAGSGGYTFIPQIDSSGVLSWTIEQPDTAPSSLIPDPVDLKGQPGRPGYRYGIPADFDVSATYSPATDDNPEYATVLYQGGTWIYAGSSASIGNYPPTLPETHNEYWQLLAGPGKDGDAVDGIIPFNAADVSAYRYLTVTPCHYALAVVDNEGTQYPLYSGDVVHNDSAQSTTVDLEKVLTDAGVSSGTAIEGTWKLVTNVGIGGGSGDIGHTHPNKALLDLITEDEHGNILMDGYIIVPAEHRTGGLLLLDPGAYSSNAVLIGYDTEYSSDTLLMDPGVFSYIREIQRPD